MGKNKLEKLRERMEDAKAKLHDNQLKRDALGKEFRELQAEEKTPFLSGARLLEISQRKAAIEAEHAQLKAQERELGRAAMNAEAQYNAAQRRLKEARRVLKVIANPPAWGLGDHSQYQISLFEKQAKKTISELT